MLRFQRALLGELLFIFLGVLGVVTTVIFAGLTIRLLAKGQGTGVDLMVELLPSMLPLTLSFSIPFAFLSAVSLVLGRWVADQEVMALKAAGLHLRVVALPVLALAALLSIVTTTLNAYSVPESQRALRAGVRRYLPVFLTSLRDVDRTVTLNNGRFSFSHYADGAFWNVELDRRNADGELEMKVLARKVTIWSTGEQQETDALEFYFEDANVVRAAGSGETVVEGSPRFRLQMGRVDRIGASVLFNEFFGTRRFLERPRDMPLPELMYCAARDGVWRGPMRRVGRALHGSIALGLAPLVLGLFALAVALLLPPTGRRVRDFLLGFIPPVLLYFPIYLAGHSAGGSGHVPDWAAMWAANAVVGVLGFILLQLAYRR
jgi:lipopolysaccharide export LptBFGC system permease protein LptF